MWQPCTVCHCGFWKKLKKIGNLHFFFVFPSQDGYPENYFSLVSERCALCAHEMGNAIRSEPQWYIYIPIHTAYQNSNFEGLGMELICIILRPFWYIWWSSGIFLFVLVCCTKKNLAPLLNIQIYRYTYTYVCQCTYMYVGTMSLARVSIWFVIERILAP
jgi:hypothetical protein